MQNTSQMATGKTVKLAQCALIPIFHRSWILHFKMLWQSFNEDDGSWDKGMIKVYDNFTNDYLYANPKITFSIC
jgi:hypothetical protein